MTTFQARGLATSTAISRYYVKNFIAPEDLVRLLNAARVRFVLLGAHGLAGWLPEARATQDVDLLIATRSHKKVIRLLLETFPDLEAESHEVVTRLKHRENQVALVDVIKPVEPIMREALKETHTEQTDAGPCRVPTLEMALALKFAAMISLTRADYKKYVDAGDFIGMVQKHLEIDLEKLSAFGELVYPGGGKELADKVQQVREGKRLQL